MSKAETIAIHEFGVLCADNEGKALPRSGAIPIPEKSFNNLWNFALNYRHGDLSKVLSVFKDGKRRLIRAGRYVGTIQTKDGLTIDILPKIYKSTNMEENDEDLCRRIFLQMLAASHCLNEIKIQDAALNTQKNFPILEGFISRYLTEVEQLLINGIRKNYTLVEDNQRVLKGKLLVHKQITKNCANRIKFAIRYSNYIEDIPQNRLIVSTMHKFLEISKKSINKSRCNSLLALFSEIPPSTNIQSDLLIASQSNRLFATYKNLLLWSSQFLLNNGFTTFSGEYVNQSLLFNAEKLFEKFIASLFKKYAKEYIIKKQQFKYYLIDRHGDSKKGKFRLQPDIVAESHDASNLASYDAIIIDTKWKNIDSNAPNRNYLIDIRDMYQLFAYGQKYHQGENYFLDIVPTLVLIYPYTEKFQTALKPFYYEEIKKSYGLKLMVFPFNLDDNKDGYRNQVGEIMNAACNLEGNSGIQKRKAIRIIDNPSKNHAKNFLPCSDDNYMLVGYYMNDEHLDWILKNKVYDFPLKSSCGKEEKGTRLQITPSRILLYNNSGKNIRVFTVNQSAVLIVDSKEMKSLNYPCNAKKQKKYYKLFSLESEIKQHKKIDIFKLKSKHEIENSNYAPFFVKY